MHKGKVSLWSHSLKHKLLTPDGVWGRLDGGAGHLDVVEGDDAVGVRDLAGGNLVGLQNVQAEALELFDPGALGPGGLGPAGSGAAGAQDLGPSLVWQRRGGWCKRIIPRSCGIICDPYLHQ